MIRISVIIPVYKAGEYVRTAVESALQQPEVGEVLLIEDGSPDNSLAMCRQLEHEYETVRLLQHPNGENRGAGATRNLGLQSVRFDYIAFLDADDYFFPERFKKVAQVFAEHPDADGVYDAAGIYKEGVEGYKLFTIRKVLKPEVLFHYLLRGTYGHFLTNCITFKRTLLNAAGVFNTDLRLHQDSELWLRFAFFGRLYPGEIHTPVTYVRRHENNRITHAKVANRLQFWEVVIAFFITKSIAKGDYLLILWKYCKTKASVNNTSTWKELLAVWRTDRRKVTKLFSL